MFIISKMCGIIGVISKNNLEIIKNGLIQLQNRGYDSVGISLMNKNFQTIKYASDNKDCFEKLFDNFDKLNNEGIISIGHTRWATHGKKTDENSHPHISYNKNIVLVHNGIIENYKKIKDMLIKENYNFLSETDSEVIVNLIDYYYNVKKIDFFKTLRIIQNELEGTWALLIMNKDFNNKLYCCRHGSPLIVGKSDNCAIVCSEKSALNKYISNYFILNGSDICILEERNNEIIIDTRDTYEMVINNNENIQLSPEPFKFWLEKEIYEQFNSSLRAISHGGRLLDSNKVNLGGLELNKNFLEKVDNLIIIGCGTSYNAALLSKYYFNDICNFNSVQVIDASEFSLNDICKKGITATILLSQSGETKDVYDCLSLLKENNIFTIGVINTVDSMIARETNCGCYINAGREISVASTKSFLNQVIVLSMISIWFSQIKNINEYKREKYLKCLRQLPIDIKKILDNLKISDEIIDILNENNIFILGKEKGEAIAKEGSLKIKEVAYIHAEGYSSSSLKHGPFALLNKNLPVILIILDNKFYNKNFSCYQEIISRNSPIICITNNTNEDNFERKIIIPYNEVFNELLSNIPLQMIAYKLSILKNLNPDKPRNLAKCVTTD